VASMIIWEAASTMRDRLSSVRPLSASNISTSQ